MSRLMRAEARDFNIVAQEVRVLRNFVHVSTKELLLKIEAWTPGQIATDFQIFPQAMAHHVRRRNTFGRPGVMGATGGVDMMVARPPTEFGGVYPTFHVEGSGLRFPPHLQC